MIGMNSTALSFYEQGKRAMTAETLGKIAKALNVEPNAFFAPLVLHGGTDEQQNNGGI